MSRIFPHDKGVGRVVERVRLYAARNEVEAFQIGVHAEPANALNDLSAQASDLTSSDGARISSEHVEILYADYVPVHWHSAGNPPEDLEGVAPGFYPDPLSPSLWRGVGRAQFPSTVNVWVRVRIPESASPGAYRGRVEVSCKGGKATVDFEVEVWPFALPERSHFLMTNWFLTGLILQFHHIEPLTDDFWKVIEIYARNLADHRQNVILTPLFPMSGTTQLINGRLQGQLIDIVESQPGQYQFDFHNFDRWVNLFLGYNFAAIEGGHLAGGSRHPSGALIRKPGSQTAERRSFASTADAEYRRFLSQFLSALRNHLREKGWLNQFYLHLSDEPYGDQFEPYTGLAKFVKEIAPEIRLIDAMGAAEFAPYVDHPAPLESVYERFVETSGVPREHIWFYYCCGPTGRWPNRFIDYPLIRVRIFTWVAFRYGIPGFLHWGLNHWGWHPPHYRSEMAYNPYDNTTGGSLQAGDSYVLYPPRMSSASHEPVDSIRWEIIRKAMEDYEYLYLLREQGTSEGEALLSELETRIVPNFTDHTRSENDLANFRRRAGDIIARLANG
jgi:hypothetical protein